MRPDHQVAVLLVRSHDGIYLVHGAVSMGNSPRSDYLVIICANTRSRCPVVLGEFPVPDHQVFQGGGVVGNVSTVRLVKLVLRGDAVTRPGRAPAAVTRRPATSLYRLDWVSNAEATTRYSLRSLFQPRGSPEITVCLGEDLEFRPKPGAIPGNRRPQISLRV